MKIHLKKQSYFVLAEGINFEDIKKNLPAEEYNSFLETRIEVLNLATQALQAMKWGFGTGMIIKDYFDFRAESKAAEKLMADAEELHPGQRADVIAAIQRALPELKQRQYESESKSFREKSHAMITRILNGIDRQLWSQAAIVAHANEFGVLAAVGLQAESGNSDGVGRGGLTDIGLSIGFNRDEKSLAIQIFNGREVFKTTDMPMIMIAGLVGKAGFYVANQGKDLSAYGTSFYPPVAPAFSTSTNRSFMIGASSGLTWPPSPIGDLLTYTNQLKQTTVVRITISPLTKGFVRFKFGQIKELLSAAVVGIKELIPVFQMQRNILRCETLFR